VKRFIEDIRWMYRGLQEIRRIRPWLITLLVIRAIVESLPIFVNIYLAALLTDRVVDQAPWQRLVEPAAIMVTLHLFLALLSGLLNRFINMMKAEFDHRYEMGLSLKIIDMDYASVENPETHRLREKINEVRNMNDGGIWRLIHSSYELIRNLCGIIFSVSLTFSLFTLGGGDGLSGIFVFVASPLFSILLGLGILGNVWVGMYANATVTRKMYTILNGMIPLNRLFFYYVNNYISTYHAGKDIRIYDQQGLIRSEWMALMDGAKTTLGKLSRNKMKYSGMTTFSTVIISTIIYVFVGLKAMAGLFSVGYIIRYIGSINEFTNAFTGFMNQLATLRANNENLKIYFNFFNIPSKMYHGKLPVEKRALCQDGDNEYEIEFRHVSFKYPSSDTYSLRDVSLRLKIGERLAVVGMNGSGKTTLIKLLCRLYDPTEGEILLNGINIQKYDYEEYMSIFSVVFQDFKLFSFSLGQNVAAEVGYDKEIVEECLEEAGFGQRYEELASAAETNLYKDFDNAGVEISGGEAQKIALARALYKNAPFIILDEPTAALDPIAEFEIYSKFNNIVGNRTAIYISHRLSSCRFCDNIVVFHEGRLIQQGSHGELVADSGGKYHELWHAQAQYYND